jgi:sodium transport system ATP-binding protein
MIEVSALRKAFGPATALWDVTFSAPDGSITGLLGGNGAGKTTCLRIIAGALKPDAGAVRIDGHIGALLDHNGLYARLTVRENIAYFGERKGCHRMFWRRALMSFSHVWCCVQWRIAELPVFRRGKARR